MPTIETAVKAVEVTPAKGTIPVSQTVAAEALEHIRNDHGGQLEPAHVVEAARSEHHPLHCCFVWDDTEAARRFREVQATILIKTVRVKYSQPPAPKKIGTFKVKAYHGSAPVQIEPMSHEESQSPYEEAIEQLKGIRQRYSHVKELEGVFIMIDAELEPEATGETGPLTEEQKSLVEQYLLDYETPMKMLTLKYGKYLKRATAHGIDHEEQEQLAMVGLMRAAQRFDSSKGFKFATFALLETLSPITRALQKTESVASKPGGRLVLSGDYTSIQGKKGGDACSIFETIGECDEERPTELPPAIIERLQGLHPRLRLIIEMQHGLNGQEPHTLEAIGQRFQVSRERVRQLAESALNKLRGVMDEEIPLEDLVA